MILISKRLYTITDSISIVGSRRKAIGGLAAPQQVRALKVASFSHSIPRSRSFSVVSTAHRRAGRSVQIAKKWGIHRNSLSKCLRQLSECKEAGANTYEL